MAQGIPVVVADRDIPQTLADVMLVDNEKGGYEATRYLISLGHRRSACIGGPSGLTPARTGCADIDGRGQRRVFPSRRAGSRIQGDGNDGPRQRTALETRLVVRDSCALR